MRSDRYLVVALAFFLVFSCFFVSGIMVGNGEPDLSVPAVVPDDSGSSSGGGGGGSSGTYGMTYVVSAGQFIAGYSADLSVNDRVKVTVGVDVHYVKVVGMTATTASINVSSTTQEATLVVGDIRKFDVSEDGYYDMSVTLNSINATSSEVSVFVKSIREEVTEESVAAEEGMDADAITIAAAESGWGMWWVWIVVIVVVIGVVVYYLKKSNSFIK